MKFRRGLKNKDGIMFGYSGVLEFLVAALAIILAIMLHELAHGYVALWNGDPTAKYNGRLSLNPIAHFDIFGLMMLLLARIGYARPVPINPNNFRNRKLGLLTVSLAGILFNLLLAFLFVPLLFLCNNGAINAIAQGNEVLANLFYYLREFCVWFVIINVNLALFNILPIYPLDGYNVVEGVTRATNKYNKFMRNYGQYLLLILVGISIIVDVMRMPYFMDPLGLYINTFRNWIVDAFSKFWSFVI